MNAMVSRAAGIGPKSKIQGLIYRNLVQRRAINKALDLFGKMMRTFGLSYATGLTRDKATLYASKDETEILAAKFRLSGLVCGLNNKNAHRALLHYERSRFDKSQKIGMQEESEALRRLKDPSYLPTRNEIYEAFPRVCRMMKEWEIFCSDIINPVFEILTVEFVNALANYLSSQAIRMGATTTDPITVLEVGAGNGRLTHFLRQALDKLSPGIINIIAADSYDWAIDPIFSVDKLDHKSALKKYKPRMVICSWMPYKEDFTAAFRARDCVEEYILIGQTDFGCCGDKWLTWGEGKYGKTKPYEKDGFIRRALPDVSRHQICKIDTWESPNEGSCSETVSFARII